MEKMMKKNKLIFLLLIFVNSLVCSAVEIGDPVPELQIKAWLKNGVVNISEGKGKNVYIIDFWKTTCKPCIKTMPYLDKLNELYRNHDLKIISISTESAETVKRFLEKRKKTDCIIAVDDDNKTFKSFVGDKEDIPVAFIINRSGTVVWKGHPLDIYLPLKRVITGKFDVNKSAQMQKVYRDIQLLLAQKKYSEALTIVEEQLKAKQDTTQFIALKSFILFKTEKKDEALSFITEMLKKFPTDLELFDLKVFMLGSMNKSKELDEFYISFIESCKDRPLFLNQLSRRLLGVKFAEARLKPALRAAEVAYSSRKLDKLQRADVGETLARIYYMVGSIDRAIKIQNIVCRILKENKKPKYVQAFQILKYYVQAYKLGQGQKVK
jgi:thiol-disulfide isomerase/thioredoxin